MNSLRIDSQVLGQGEFGPTPLQIKNASAALMDDLSDKNHQVAKPITCLRALKNRNLNDLLTWVDSGIPVIA
jgi:hypothetical protein